MSSNCEDWIKWSAMFWTIFCSVTCLQNCLASSHRWLKNSATNSFYCIFRCILLHRIQVLFLVYFYHFISIFKIHLKNLFWSGLKKIWGQGILTKTSQDILRTCPGHVLCPVLCPQIFLARPGHFQLRQRFKGSPANLTAFTKLKRCARWLEYRTNTWLDWTKSCPFDTACLHAKTGSSVQGSLIPLATSSHCLLWKEWNSNPNWVGGEQNCAKEMDAPEYENKGNTVGLLFSLLQPYFTSCCYIVLNLGFYVLKEMVELRKR